MQNNSKFLMPLTVSQFLDSVNFLLSTGTPLVLGEVVEFKEGSKWVSFSLQDAGDGSILKCALGSWEYRRIGVLLENGMQIKISGAPRITKKYGSFSMWVSSIEPVGEGSLKKAYELLKKQLYGEGLFERKRVLPQIINKIGVITSKEGVVIHDFVNNLKQIGIEVYFYPSRVEGKDAVSEIISGISYFNSAIPDLDAIVVIRGGGSLESMQAFNNEKVCRSISASKIPTICGIGHDVDVPLACLVADVSVSTPTAAANLINNTYDELLSSINLLGQKVFIKLRELFFKVDILERKIKMDAIAKIDQYIATTKSFIKHMENFLDMASPLRNLKLGYAMVFDSAGKLVKSIDDVKVKDSVETKMFGGSIKSEIKLIKKYK